MTPTLTLVSLHSSEHNIHHNKHAPVKVWLTRSERTTSSVIFTKQILGISKSFCSQDLPSIGLFILRRRHFRGKIFKNRSFGFGLKSGVKS